MQRILPTLVSVLAVLLLSANLEADSKPGLEAQLSTRDRLSLHFTLTLGREAHGKMYRNLLPWGSVHSLTLVAIVSGRDQLKRELLIDDPSPEEISLEPLNSFTGDVNLRNLFIGLEKASTKSDIIVFWAYKAPKELGLPHWSGGWVLIPCEKK